MLWFRLIRLWWNICISFCHRIRIKQTFLTMSFPLSLLSFQVCWWWDDNTWSPSLLLCVQKFFTIVAHSVDKVGRGDVVKKEVQVLPYWTVFQPHWKRLHRPLCIFANQWGSTTEHKPNAWISIWICGLGWTTNSRSSASGYLMIISCIKIY